MIPRLSPSARRWRWSMPVGTRGGPRLRNCRRDLLDLADTLCWKRSFGIWSIEAACRRECAVKVQVKLFAGMAETAGATALTLEVPEGAMVADVLADLRKRITRRW